ncbi:MAG: phage tail tape measure protein [Armatimonadia bacterium]
MPEKKMLVSLILRAKDDASGALKAVDKEIDKVEGSLRGAAVAQAKTNATWAATSSLLNRAALGMAAAGAAITGAVAGLGYAAIRMGGDIKESAMQLGLSTEAYTRLKFAAEQSGASIQAVGAGMSRLARNALEASKGSGQAAEAFRTLGINVTDGNGQLKTQEVLLGEVADALAGVDNPMLRLALAQQIMGRGAKQMMPLLLEGSEGMRKLAKRAEELGLVIGDDVASQLDDAGDSLEAAKQSMQATGMMIGAAFAPAMAQAALMVAKFLGPLRTVAKENQGLTKLLGTLAMFGGAGLLGLAAFIKMAMGAKVALDLLRSAEAKVVIAKIRDVAASIAAAIANTGLAASFTAVAAAASAAWKAITGPIGWIIGLLGLLVTGIGLVVKHFRLKAQASQDAAAGTTEAGKAAQATAEQLEAEGKAAEDARKAYAEAAKEYTAALRDRPRAERDAAIAVRDARESLEEALKGQVTAQEDATRAVQDAEQAATQAREDAAEAAIKASRDISKAEESAAETSRRAVEDMVRSEEGLAKAKQRVAEAEKDIARAMAGGHGDINKAQQDAAQRITDAQGRLRDAQLTAGGVRETEAQRNARALMEAQQDLLQARKDAEASVSQARQKAAEDTARALEQWKEAQQALVTSEQELAQVQVDAPKRIAEAEQQLADARTAAAEATQQASDKITQADAALVKAREDASERIVQADRALRNAQESLVRAQEDAIDRVAQAIERVAKALEDMKQKQADLPTVGAAGKSTGTPARLTPKQRVAASTRAHDSTWEAMGASGAMASGGSVFAGRTYLVGERGPELFTAPATGSIIPNGALSGRTVVVNFNAPIYGDEALRQVARNEVGKAVRVASYA